MLESFLITFRETLEAALIIGIVLSYLNRTGRKRFRTSVWWGAGSAIAVSVLLALFLNLVAGGFSGRTEEIYEGMLMLIGAGLLTWMIFWMRQQSKGIKQELETKTQAALTTGAWAIFALVFVAVVREGVETVIFLLASSTDANDPWHLGATAGILIAGGLGLALYRGVKNLPLSKFFAGTSVLLLLFAAGLVSHGIHELQEAGIMPVVIEHVWDVNYAFSESSTLGTFAKGLFGYNGNPSLIEVVSYTVYVGLIATFWVRLRKPAADPARSE